MAENAFNIRVIGDPGLREPARPVSDEELGSESLRALIDELAEFMRSSQGLGIAAPQVGLKKRLVLMEVRDNPRYPKTPPLPLLALINPSLRPLTEQQERAFEGCLSIPNMRGPVWRTASIAVDFFDAEGQPRSFEFDGPFARIVQHELDHLDGILYFDRIKAEDLKDFGHERALQAAGVDLTLSRATPAAWRDLS